MLQDVRSRLNDRGVSPVIGVILMVAITVILAAVIGSFVLGIGGDVEKAPQASLTADLNDSSQYEIVHQGGDSINSGDVTITGSSSGGVGVSNNAELGPGDTWKLNVSLEEDETVTIVHNPSDKIIAEFEV